MADSHDITPHVQMWHYFTRIIGFSCLGLAVLLALMAIFLT
ncbi:MAG TPA: aa3-type cytochrome c oxidase subunit IV [Alphaproteobacteria bacterium]|jgi:hypothetical protein